MIPSELIDISVYQVSASLDMTRERLVKIDAGLVPLAAIPLQGLISSWPFIYRNQPRGRQYGVFALYKTYRISHNERRIENISCKYYANMSRGGAWNSVPVSALCAAFRRPANFSRENVGVHIKHVVIPLNPVSGINRHGTRWRRWRPSFAMGIKIKFFNKTNLSSPAANFIVPFSRLIPYRCASAEHREKLKTQRSERKAEREREKKIQVARSPSQINTRLLLSFFLCSSSQRYIYRRYR